jgi:hypothetical protein
MKSFTENKNLENHFPYIGKMVENYLVIGFNRQIIPTFQMNGLAPFWNIPTKENNNGHRK